MRRELHSSPAFRTDPTVTNSPSDSPPLRKTSAGKRSHALTANTDDVDDLALVPSPQSPSVKNYVDSSRLDMRQAVINASSEEELESDREPEALTCSAKASLCWNSSPMFYLATAGNLFYAVGVSVLFGAFSFRRVNNDNISNVPLGIAYATCSFIMNAPMAWFFLERLKTTILRFGKKEPLFIGMAVVALAFAIGTMAPGFKVAQDSVAEFKALNVGFRAVLTALFIFNTFSTRFVGSTYLLFTIAQKLIEPYQRLFTQHSSYYQLRDDLEKHGKEVNVNIVRREGVSEEALLRQYVEAFYPALISLGHRPGNNFSENIKEGLLLLVAFTIFSTLMINMSPIWIYLTVKGCQKISNSLSQSAPFVIFASASNEFFYLNSGLKFIYTFVNFSLAVCAYKVKKFSEYNQTKVNIGFAVSAFAFFALLGAAAYFSGEGYGSAAADGMKDGFGPIAEKYWFSWIGKWTNLFPLDYLATVAAGLIVNGGAFLDFCLLRIPFLQSPKTSENNFGYRDALALLNGRFEAIAFDKLDNENVSEAINLRRGLANPHSLWADCCRGSTDDEVEELLTLSNQSYGTTVV